MLVVGMQTSTETMENRMKIPQETKIELSHPYQSTAELENFFKNLNLVNKIISSVLS